MSKIYSEERWDEDDACIECGEPLVRESKVPGLCQICYAEMNPLKAGGTVGRVSVRVEPPEADEPA